MLEDQICRKLKVQFKDLIDLCGFQVIIVEAAVCGAVEL